MRGGGGSRSAARNHLTHTERSITGTCHCPENGVHITVTQAKCIARKKAADRKEVFLTWVVNLRDTGTSASRPKSLLW